MFKKFAAILLCVTMTVGMTGCQKSGAEETDKSQNEESKTENVRDNSEEQASKAESDGTGSGEEVQIPMILTTGTNDAQDIVTGKIVDDFNEEYKGKYHIEL